MRTAQRFFEKYVYGGLVVRQRAQAASGVVGVRVDAGKKHLGAADHRGDFEKRAVATDADDCMAGVSMLLGDFCKQMSPEREDERRKHQINKTARIENSINPNGE